MTMKHILLSMALLPLCTHVAAQGQGNVCGSLEFAYGPYDYRVERGRRLNVVERFHFTPEVEALIHGESGYLGGDLDYVLMTSPNHHRALMATMRYGERLKTTQPPAMKYSIDCYFERAIRFQPDDTVVREMFAQYLGKGGHLKEAKDQLAAASTYAKDNAISHYNIGLIYFELKDYDHALEQAQLASAEGYARPELRDELKRLGKWQDAPAAAGAQASATSAVPATSAASPPP
jgi:tetratricopeptide (TPR) repeat protein